MVSYIKEFNSFIEYAAEHRVSASECTFYHALLYIFNKRARGASFPKGFISISNKQLLAYLPFSERTLIYAREGLLNKNPCIFEYKRGERNTSSPMYKLNYFSINSNILYNKDNYYEPYKHKEKASEELAYNRAWLYDTKAQRAVAFNILDSLKGFYGNGFDGSVFLVCDLLSQGMEPEQIKEALEYCKDANYMPFHLKAYIERKGLDYDVFGQ